jgi:hypothetical protein
VRIGFAIMALALATSAARAALPPQYQARRTLVQILESQLVSDAVGGNSIMSISTTDNITYVLKAETCEIVVQLVDVERPDGEVGPRNFDVTIQSSTCK